MNEQSEIGAGDGVDTIATRMMTHLREAIVRLDLKPGDTISEAEVAERFGVSRQPVREAFIRLGQQGLLLIRPKRATMVKRISEDGVAQSRFIREAIEVEIIRRAAAALTEATGPMLEGILAQQNEAAAAGDIDRFHTLDETFHRALAQTAGVEYAWQLIDDHKIQLDRVRYLTLPRSDPPRTIGEHRAIVDAVLAGDAVTAEAALRAHLGKAEALLHQAKADFPEYFE